MEIRQCILANAGIRLHYISRTESYASRLSGGKFTLSCESNPVENEESIAICRDSFFDNYQRLESLKRQMCKYNNLLDNSHKERR